jgi:hypothetical protein
MTLVGFVFTYPDNTLTPDARSAVDISALSFDAFGLNFEVARSAARIVRNLGSKLDLLAAFRSSQQTSNTTSDLTTEVGTTVSMNFTNEPWVNGYNDPSMNSFDVDGGTGSNLFDMALGVEFWGSVDDLWPAIDIPATSWIAA